MCYGCNKELTENSSNKCIGTIFLYMKFLRHEKNKIILKGLFILREPERF